MKIGLTLFFGFIFSTVLAQFENIPISLSIPFDTDTIETVNPTFVWQCNLSAIQNDPRLSLQFALVKLEANQTPSEAIATNPTICFMDGVMSSSLSYPSSLEPLEKGRSYIWQVRLLYNQQIVQVSEPWKFTIANPQPIKHQYILARKKLDGSTYIIQEPILYIMLKNEGKNVDTNVWIVNSNNEKQALKLKSVLVDENQPSKLLSNFYFVADMSDLDLENGNYTLKWEAIKNEMLFINFQLQ
jgi:hypothetical protein